MPTPEITPLHHDLDFNCPLSNERASRLIGTLGPLSGRRVVDLGCGWAELLLRVLATEPTATGVGVDLDLVAIEHGLAGAAARGLADRVDLIVGDAGQWSGEPADVLINNGSSHVWGGEPRLHTANALDAVRDLLHPGGRLLFGECFWRRPPTEAEQAVMPMPRDQYGSMADLVDLAQTRGYRLLSLSQASVDEWDDYQTRYGLGWENWLLDNPGSPDAHEVRERADQNRTWWLRGSRETLGYAYLTLVRG